MDVAVIDRPVVVTVAFARISTITTSGSWRLVKLRYLVALQPQRRRHGLARVPADRLPALQAHGRARRPVEGELHHRIGREQVSEAVGIAGQHQLAAAGQDVGGRGV